MGYKAARTIKFDSFLVDLDALEVRRNGNTVQIEPQVFDIIAFLCANPGRVVNHDEIVENVWHGRIVSNSTIATRINAARKALGDDGAAQKIIKTVRGRGFRFELTPVDDESADAELERLGQQEQFVLCCTPHAYSLLMLTRCSRDSRQAWRDLLPESLAYCAAQHGSLENTRHTAVFVNAIDALRCAVALMQSIANHCERSAPADRWTAKIGIGHGTAADNAAYGRGIRLDAAAPPGVICISSRVMELLAGQIDLDIEALAADAGLGSGGAFKVTRIEDLLLSDAVSIDMTQTFGLSIPEPAEVSVVVLPFETIGGNHEVEEAATGLRLEIQNALAQLSGITPIAAGTAMAFSGSMSPNVAVELGLRYVLQGNVRAIGRSVRLMIELYDHHRAGVSFSRTYDGSLDDGFDFQDQMTARVVDALDVKVLSGQQARIWHKSYSNPKAIQVQYRGMHEFFKMSKETMVVARECFEQLHSMRPDISIGATWLSMCHWFELQRGWTSNPEASLKAVKKWASVAIGMEDADGQAHTALCHAYMIEREFDQALRIGEKAVMLRPSCANANGFYAHALYYCGLIEKAVHHVKLAIRFSPAYPPLFGVVLSGALHAQGDHEGAISVAQELIRLATNDPMAKVILISALMEANRPLEAHTVAQGICGINAKISIDTLLERMPFRHDHMREQLSSNFRKSLD